MVTESFSIGELSYEFGHSKANPEKHRKEKKPPPAPLLYGVTPFCPTSLSHNGSCPSTAKAAFHQKQ